MENRFEPIEPNETYKANAPWSSARSEHGGSVRTGLCAEAHDAIPELVEGGSAEYERLSPAIANHIEVCPECAAELRSMQHLVSALDNLPAAELPRDYAPLIMARIEQTSAEGYASDGFGTALDAHASDQATSRERGMARMAQHQLDEAGRESETVKQARGIAAVVALLLAIVVVTILVVVAALGSLLGASVTEAERWAESISRGLERVPIIGPPSEALLEFAARGIAFLASRIGLGAFRVLSAFVDALLVRLEADRRMRALR